MECPEGLTSGNPVACSGQVGFGPGYSQLRRRVAPPAGAAARMRPAVTDGARLLAVAWGAACGVKGLILLPFINHGSQKGTGSAALDRGGARAVASTLEPSDRRRKTVCCCRRSSVAAKAVAAALTVLQIRTSTV